MRLLVVGAGSTGGYFGGRLAQAGYDVVFLVRPAREAWLRREGLRITSPHGDATLHPQLVIAGAIDKPFEVVLLTVKGFQLAAAIEDMAPAVGQETMILPVLNGMSHMDILAGRFSRQNLIGCAAKVATILEDDGQIAQLTPFQDFAYGELDGSQTPRILALDAFMKAANIGARLSEFIRREMWEKWVLLAGLGAITCLMRGTIGEIESSQGGGAFVEQLLDEVVTVVRAVGEPPSEAFVSSARKQFTAKGSPLASSMFRDLSHGRPIEAETIIGDLLRYGQKSNISTPLFAVAYTNLLVYQNQISARRATLP